MIGVDPEMREEIMRHTKSRVRQGEFQLSDDALWKQVPQKERRRCVELLARLLGVIVQREIGEEETDDGRQDHTGAP